MEATRHLINGIDETNLQENSKAIRRLYLVLQTSFSAEERCPSTITKNVSQENAIATHCQAIHGC